MSFNTRLFLILWLAGLSGILSFLLVDLSAILANLPVPPGPEIPDLTPAIRLLSMFQPLVILTVAVLIGVGLAPRAGLSAPAAEAAAAKPINGKSVAEALAPQIVPGTAGGLAGGAAIVVMGLLVRQFLNPEIMGRISEFSKQVPLATRLLYGGLTEELLLRWGLMTLLVWAAWKIFQNRTSKPSPACYAGAILVSSVIFGIGHLPIAFLLFPDITFSLIIYVIVANSLFGLIAGYLFWKKGLEAAMMAHMTAHLVMFIADYFGA